MSGPSPLILKVGGNEIDDDSFLAGFVRAVAELQRTTPVVVVHGGGKEIAELHAQLNVPFEMVDGLRATSAESLRLVEMVLSGLVNTRLTRWLVNAGVEALGVNGVDLGLIRVRPLRPRGRDIGFVGQVAAVRREWLLRLLDLGVVPVVSPISLGVDGLSYNVNADQVAGALAVALAAQRLVFVSNVPGVKLNGQVTPSLTVAEVEAHIASGQISGGMIPKVRAAVDAVREGVAEAVITDLAGLVVGGGTVIGER
ncbi:MAG: acetylglutamate kinase [Anaerolineae bacterium]|nr:acetylglutamate kinase [Anaerolineae bacterium]